MKDYELIKDLGPIEIQKFQRNRYPCFFVDYISEAKPGKYAIGYKNFSYNEWFFPCHFEDEPVVPGFIQIEMLTQVFLMSFLTIPENKGLKTGFVSVNNALFKKKVVPGQKVDIEAKLDFYSRGVARGKSVGKVSGEVVCEASLTVAIPDILNSFIPHN